jgi:gentisate 1,2-dioxygenase
MAIFGEHLRALNPIPEGLREKWRQNDMVPLWETTANLFAPSSETVRQWKWDVMRPILLETAEITDPAIIERRVMQLVNTSVEATGGDATAGLMNAALQALRPDESAAPHRHSINALRFILEGEGAETVVNGRPCRMSPGDLVLTPGGAWHEHRHGGGPISIWLDILDANLHRLLGQAIFQPGPPNDLSSPYDDAMFASPNIIPVEQPARPVANTSPRSLANRNSQDASPVFRYPWQDAVRAIEAAPVRADGSRLVRYVNPLTGSACLPLIDCTLLQIADGASTTASASPADAIVSVVEGSGRSTIGKQEISWSAKDTFTLPRQALVSHVAEGGKARLFIASNEEVYRRLGLLPAQ